MNLHVYCSGCYGPTNLPLVIQVLLHGVRGAAILYHPRNMSGTLGLAPPWRRSAEVKMTVKAWRRNVPSKMGETYTMQQFTAQPLAGSLIKLPRLASLFTSQNRHNSARLDRVCSKQKKGDKADTALDCGASSPPRDKLKPSPTALSRTTACFLGLAAVLFRASTLTPAPCALVLCQVAHVSYVSSMPRPFVTSLGCSKPHVPHPRLVNLVPNLLVHLDIPKHLDALPLHPFAYIHPPSTLSSSLLLRRHRPPQLRLYICPLQERRMPPKPSHARLNPRDGLRGLAWECT